MTAIVLSCAAALAVSLFVFGWAVVRAADDADRRYGDMQALLLSGQVCDEIDAEVQRWR